MGKTRTVICVLIILAGALSIWVLIEPPYVIAKGMDTDGDGLTLEQEQAFDTEPQRADTDGDGLGDGKEHSIGTNPRVADTDDDGIHDGNELSIGTNPRVENENTGVDSDNDGMVDSLESTALTNPNDSDTDNDGIPDGSELYNDNFRNGTPVHKDIYVEVDTEQGHALEENFENTLQTNVFADAPVSNPDNTTGMTLHIIRDDTLSNVSTTRYGSPEKEALNRYSDKTKFGYYYILVLEAPQTDENGESGAAYADSIGYVFDEDTTNHHVFLHELGHLLGLHYGLKGVDDKEISAENYPSVMNYNFDSSELQYSDGTHSNEDRNDWQYITNHLEHKDPTALNPAEHINHTS